MNLSGVKLDGAGVVFNPDALPADAKLSDLAARIVALLTVGKLRAATGPEEQAAVVGELERLAPKLEPHIVRWERERRRSHRLRLAKIVHRLLGRPQTRDRGRSSRRATLRRSPARSPGSRPDDEPDPVARPRRASRRARAAA